MCVCVCVCGRARVRVCVRARALLFIKQEIKEWTTIKIWQKYDTKKIYKTHRMLLKRFTKQSAQHKLVSEFQN